MKINIGITLSYEEIKMLRVYDFSGHVSCFDILDDDSSIIDNLIALGILCKDHIDNEITGTKIYEKVIVQLDILADTRDTLAQKLTYNNYAHLIMNIDNLSKLEKSTINILFEFENLPKPFGMNTQ